MDGTVQRRFQNGTVAGQALLKTGSLEGVRALAGYVIDAEGRRFIVVAIVNHRNAARGPAALDSSCSGSIAARDLGPEVAALTRTSATARGPMQRRGGPLQSCPGSACCP